MTRESGNGSRTFKSALLWVLADGDGALPTYAWGTAGPPVADALLGEREWRKL